MYRNLDQTIVVFVFDRSTNKPVDTDAANLSCEISINDGGLQPLNNNVAAFVKSGKYRFNISAAECETAITLDPFAVSANPNVEVLVLWHHRTLMPRSFAMVNDQSEVVNLDVVLP